MTTLDTWYHFQRGRASGDVDLDHLFVSIEFFLVVFFVGHARIAGHSKMRRGPNLARGPGFAHRRPIEYRLRLARRRISDYI